MLRKNPGFTAVAVLTLGLCIGANLVIFAVVDAILIRSLPFPDADRLVVVHNAYPTVSQRRREVGVRIALGATPPQIGLQFMSLGFRLFAVGVLFGCLGAWAAGRAMQAILFEVPSFHIATVAGTAVAMSLVTLLASLLPAIRAARISPAEAMRNE